MGGEQSLLMYFIHAGIVVKIVMLMLLGASVATWTIIIQRSQFFRRAKQSVSKFQKTFWSGKELNQLFVGLGSEDQRLFGLESIFQSGFKEFLRLQHRGGAKSPSELDGMQRAMRIAYVQESEKLDNHLSFLATVASISPYVGLFGTVWGIMTALQALGHVQQATISMVAPGISEALIATAMGLFAAIPAGIAYNRFSSQADRMLSQFDTFQDELFSILHHEALKDATYAVRTL